MFETTNILLSEKRQYRGHSENQRMVLNCTEGQPRGHLLPKLGSYSPFRQPKNGRYQKKKILVPTPSLLAAK
jgi:hypothetical protein